MAHNSRLAGFIIDCQTDHLDSAASFWSQALGLPITDPNEAGENRYARLADGPGELHVEVQCVEHESRVHLDIESDDIEAEVKRLAKIGAVEVSRPRHGRWVVMQAPTGQRFCVVRMAEDRPPSDSNRWQD